MMLVTICLKHEGVSQKLRKKLEEGKDGAEPCQRCCCSRENCPEWAFITQRCASKCDEFVTLRCLLGADRSQPGYMLGIKRGNLYC